MFNKTNTKVSVFGHQTNLLTDIKIKITKFLAISQIHHLMKLHGNKVGHLDLIHTIQTVKFSQLIQLHHNSIQPWLIVLKMLDPSWLIKLNNFGMDNLQFHHLTAQLQLGIHAECAKMELS